MPEWQVVCHILADLDRIAVEQIRNGDADTETMLHPLDKIRAAETIRAPFRAIAANNGMDDPFAPRH